MKPILFNTEMVRAILDGRKTVTRRMVKGYPLEHLELDVDGSIIGVYDQFDGCVFPIMDYAPYHTGDILYVRETWTKLVGSLIYKADQKPGMMNQGKWLPSIRMPKEAARLFLRVTDVRVERLRDITYDGAIREGADRGRALNNFAWIWDSTIKPTDRAIYGWEANPWVWVIEFERITKEEAENG